jgi:hypothetical protein
MSDRGRTIIIRLNKIERRIFPPGSVAFNIKSLSPQDRAVFDRHREECAAWTKARPGEKAYTDLLAGEMPPELPRCIHEKIYPAYQEALSAEENYMNLVENMRCS